MISNIEKQRVGIQVGEHLHHEQCRFCHSESLKEVIDFGYVPLAGGFHKSKESTLSEKKYPLKICFCENCGLVQVDNAISADVLFKDYFYFSSAIGTLKNHFENYSEELLSLFPLPDGVKVLEIGCNDGVFLKPLAKQGFDVIGVDPATNVVAPLIDEGFNVYNECWTEEIAEKVVSEHGEVELFLSSNSFAHIDDMKTVLLGVKKVLSDDGVLAFETHYLPTLLTEMQYDMLYHEHINYYSLHSINSMAELYDMEVFDVKKIPIHAGSVRYYLKNKGSNKFPVTDAVREMNAAEKDLKISEYDTYVSFKERVNKTRSDLLEVLSEIKASGKTVVGYGASGRATQLSAYCGIGSEYLDYVIDDAPAKQGCFTPGNHMEIVGSDILNSENRPDYCLLFAWSFADEIKKRNPEYFESGGKFIVPLPEVRII